MIAGMTAGIDLTTPAQHLGPGDFPYPSQRLAVAATRGVVCTSKGLAAQAGLSMLQRGGNAVDAALATAITLTIVEPCSNGIGSDAFALVWDGSKLHGLNGSGRAPAAHTPKLFAELGHNSVPAHGWLAVTIPGAPALWRDLHGRFGKLAFATLFEPAVVYAEQGHPIAPGLAGPWETGLRIMQRLDGPEYQGWFQTFAPDGRAPRAGDLWASPDHARTLRLIAESNAGEFYEGKIAGEIADFAAATGGYVTREDLAAHSSSWVEPISTNYRGVDVWEIPPNGQGIAALEALNILEGFDLTRHPRESVESYHLQVEAMKVAYADARRYVADPEHAAVPVAGMLDKSYAAERRKLIGDRALQPSPGIPPKGGTVYLCAADGDGLMVSLIQSNFAGFGSGVVVPGTGIALQNRGHGFTLDLAHPNVLAPGKRPYHTIIPSFLTAGGQAIGPFGVMGGAMQPQGHVQMVVNQLDYGLNPQASLDAPRWQWLQDREIALEIGVPAHVVRGLSDRGHSVTVPSTIGSFGHGQIIRRLTNGAYIAGTEPRIDGCVAAY
jgi:gamma-glutamyltranspeptidase/glutathione hydrolase